MTSTSEPTTSAAPTTAPEEDAGPDAPVSVAEAVTTSLTGIVIGGAALWFLAPICFSC